MRKFFSGMMLLALSLALSSVGIAADRQVVAGAGPSTKVVEQFFAVFAENPAAAGVEFVVPPQSTKHAGGIKNSEAYLFGRTGRPLNAKERAGNKQDIFLAKVPIAFASGSSSKIVSLSLEQIRKIYLGEIVQWSEVGGPAVRIVKVGREPTEALFSELKEEYPFFKQAEFDVVFKKDHQVVDFLKSPVGKYAIAFGAKPNFSEVTQIEVDGGFYAGVRLGLVIDKRNADVPLVKEVSRFAGSREWQKQVVRAGLIPVAN